MDWQPWAIVAIAVFGVSIAYGQWHTARSKLILDLFNQRMEIYGQLRQAVASVLTRGGAEQAILFQWGDASERARFLFGPEIERYLLTLWKSFNAINDMNRVIDAHSTTPDKQKHAFDQRKTHWAKVEDFYSTFPALLESYTRMDHKKPWLALLWDRARRRK